MVLHPTWFSHRNTGCGSGLFYPVRAEPRRFPPPWSVEDIGAAFKVCDSTGQALAYVYFEDDPGAVGSQAKREASRLQNCRGLLGGVRTQARHSQSTDGENSWPELVGK